MTTEEKLFIQIFDRKNSIIEQVRQQTEFYIQNLASKLLIDGITPPPWLWNPNSLSQSSDPKELNKEDLISKLLLQTSRNVAPYVSGHCSVYDKPAVTRDNTELSGRYCMDTHASSKKVNGSVSMLESRDNDVGCALNGVPEVDFSVNSPLDETDARISNIYSAPDQSLARIQRSRSRQKALELRTTAKAAAKSRFNHENSSGICFSENPMSRIDFPQEKGSSKSAKHYDEVSGKKTGPREANAENCGEGFSTNSHRNGITKSRSPCKQTVSVTQFHGDGYSNVIKENGDVLLQSAHKDSELKEMTNTSTSGSSIVREAAEWKCWDKQQGSEFCGRITGSRSSSLQAHFLNNSSLLNTSIYTAKAGSATLAQSMDKPAEEVACSNQLREAVIPSVKFIGRKTRSQATSCNEDTSLPVKSSGIADRRITRSKSGATKESPLAKSLNKNEEYALPNASDCQLIPDCPIDVNQHGNAEVGIQLVDGHAEAQPLYLGSNYIGAALIKDSEGLVLSPSSNSHMVVQPKQLVFDDMEEHNFSKNFSPLLREESVNRPSGEGSSVLLDTLASPDEVSHEVTPDSPNKSLWKEHSQMLKNVPTKLEEAQNNVNEEDCSEDEIGKLGSKVNKNQVVNTSECNSEAALRNRVSFLEDGAPSDFLSNSDKKAHLEICEVIEGYLPSSKLQIEEDEFGSKEKNNGSTTLSKSMYKLEDPSVISTLAKKRNACLQNCLDKEVRIPEPTGFHSARQLVVEDMQHIVHVENTHICPERMLVKSNTDVGEDDVSAHCLIGLQYMDDNNASFSGQLEVQFAKSTLLPEMKINPTKVESWPQSKRRKVEYQIFNGLSASPSFRLQMPHNIRKGTSRYLENTDSISGSGQEFQVLSLSEEGKLSQPNSSKSSDEGTYDEIQFLMTSDIDFSPSLQVKEVEVGSEVDNITVGTPSYLQSLTNRTADGSTYSLGEGFKTADPTSRLGDARNMCPGCKVSEVNGDNLTADRNFPKINSHVIGDGLLSYLSGRSPQNDRDSVGPDETMPAFEGFVIDGQTENGGLENDGDRINFNTLNLPSTTSEHTSILEKICKSASMRTPLSHFSSKFKVREIQNLYQSVPNGLLEGADLKNTLPLDMDAHKLHASYSYVEEHKTSLNGSMYSNSLSYSGTPFGYNSRIHYATPVGKLWERYSSSSSSSEKRLSFNPELTCFPIKEGSNDCEENENDEIQQDIVSIVLDDSAKTQPHVEITEACGPAPSISASEKHLNRDSLESVTTEFSFKATHNSVKQKLRNHRSNKRITKEGKENQTSLGAQSTKKGIKSLHNRFSKPKLPGKTSLIKGVERVSQKEPKHNNIVTSLTSFIPLVQQKPAASICPAKRDIKVKALEAAEVAKRLEEKRVNERKMKIEALKLERARIEKEKLREIELNNKTKEEEQKKRGADIAARKMLRGEAEDERKEKEKKRKCVAEGRREQKWAEDKSRAGKLKKDKHGKMDEKVIRGKGAENPLEKKKKIVNECGDENYLKKPNTNLQSSYVLEDHDAASFRENEGKQTSIVEKTAERNDSASVRSLEKSYDISPYQCSDDEEEDEIPTTKFIPSWASVDIALTLQKNLDPDIIFPRESFCSMDEVLQPRRREVK